MAKKTLKQLLKFVGQNPTLTDELIVAKSSQEKIAILINHKFINSADDLPSEQQLKKEVKELLTPSAKRGEVLKGIETIVGFVAIGASYED